jgi:hypothetical protein
MVFVSVSWLINAGKCAFNLNLIYYLKSFIFIAFSSCLFIYLAAAFNLVITTIITNMYQT